MKTYRFMLLIQQDYTFEILRPLQAEINARGDDVLWLALGDSVNFDLFDKTENVISSIAEAIAFAPNAIFVTGNVVPDFIPGLKVQIFHGFEWKKKGHFRIRGSFDLYCTQGPLFTRKFDSFAKQYGYFDVVETGWPKMDNVFPLQSKGVERTKKQILYLPTFSPSLTSTTALLPQIKTLASHDTYDWIIKFHPKMSKNVIESYLEISESLPNVTVYQNSDLMTLISNCDIVLSDTSSAIAESLLYRKPVVTYKNSQPDEFVIDFDEPDQLASVLESVCFKKEPQDDVFDLFASEYHPSSDGKASSRVISATVERIENGLTTRGKKPANFFRNLKLRKQENYWPWTRSS